MIYQVFGRDITQNLLDVDEAISGIKVTGYIGKPLVSRGNRNYENYYINGRYVKNNIIAKAIEDAYKDFTMQHKYPFTVLHFVMEGNTLDVNVHPTKMELRFSHQQDVYNVVYQAISNALHQKELIPCVEIPEVKKVIQESQKEEKDLNYFMKRMQERVVAYHKQPEVIENIERVSETTNYKVNKPETQKALQQVVQEPTQQLDLFQEQLLSTEKTIPHKLIGQVFDTYWLVEFQEQLYIIDQHAAHERVLYEKTLKSMKYRDYTSQYISPPIILNLSMKEADVLKQFSDIFSKIGFEIEVFGEDSYAIRAVPDNLFGIAKKELFIEMLDEISDGIHSSVAPDIISEKVASMSCKAAVKGNSKLSATEVDALINELLILDNPYHCPHGRPTIIAMTKRELEKKFKRIV